MAKKKRAATANSEVKIAGEQARERAYDALVRVLPNLEVGALLKTINPTNEVHEIIPENPLPSPGEISEYMSADENRTRAIMQSLKQELGDEMYESLIGLQERSFTEIDPYSGALGDGYEYAADAIQGETEITEESVHHLAPLEPSERALIESVDMDKLYALLSEDEQRILEQSGAFHQTTLPCEMFTERFLFPYARYDEVVHPPLGDVEVHSEPRTDLIAAQHVANELGYIDTILENTEMRHLASELYYELLAGRPVTHLALSDIVADAVQPSMVERYLMSADSTYQLSTAQYLKAYQCLREAKQQYEVDLLCAKLEGVFAAADANFFINRYTTRSLMARTQRLDPYRPPEPESE